MKLFELVSNQPVISVEGLLIPEFKKIYERDKSKDKSIAFKQLTYIYFKTDYKSLYLSFPEEDREERLLEDFIGDKKWIPDTDILKAIEKYKVFQNTPTMRFLQSNQKVMESISKYFNEVDWDKEDTSGKSKYDITKVSNAVKQAGGIIDNIEKLKDKVAKEQSLSNSVHRGGGTGGLLEFE